MSTEFLGEPDFLALLRFWEDERGDRALPLWRADMSRVPRELLPNLTVSVVEGEPIYNYVGSECIRRWGGDPTGLPIYRALKGAHSAYIWSVRQEAIARRAPIFSAAIYRPADGALLLTGRLFAPFVAPGSTEPDVMLVVQLFTGSDATIADLGAAGFVDETQRQMIVAAPELCARLEAARRYHAVARRAHQDGLAHDMARIARELAGSALVALPCFRGSEPLPGA
jgi:hypothetical protein